MQGSHLLPAEQRGRTAGLPSVLCLSPAAPGMIILHQPTLQNQPFEELPRMAEVRAYVRGLVNGLRVDVLIRLASLPLSPPRSAGDAKLHRLRGGVWSML